MKKKLLISFATVILLIGGLTVLVSQIFNKGENVNIKKDNNNLSIKDKQIKNKEKNPNIINIALFGIDKSSSKQKGESDSIMIASLDTENKGVKLTSIMKDTYIEIPERGMGKMNHAYAFGGPELAMKTINQNFDMNTRDFVKVDFEGLAKSIDFLGGVKVDIKNNEVPHVRDVPRAGTYLLNGQQALDYTRIRYVGDGDHERRQTLVLQKALEKAVGAGITKYPKLLTTMLPFVETSLSKGEILKLGTSILSSGTRNIEQFRIPADGHAVDKMINGVYYLEPDTLETNKDILYKFIYES